MPPSLLSLLLSLLICVCVGALCVTSPIASFRLYPSTFKSLRRILSDSMSFNGPQCYSDPSPPSDTPSARRGSQLSFPRSSVYLLPARDVVSRRPPFSPVQHTSTRSHGASSSSFPQVPPESIKSTPQPLLVKAPQINSFPPFSPMSDWELDLEAHYHRLLVAYTAECNAATAKAEARLAEVKREIALQETHIAYEINVASIEEQYLLERSYSLQQRILANIAKADAWGVDNGAVA